MIADFVDRRGGGLLMLGGAAFVRRRRLRRHAGRRRAAAGDRSADARVRAGAAGAAEGRADARRPDARGHAARRHRGRVDWRAGASCRRSPASTRRCRRSRARRCCSTAPTSAAAPRIVLASQPYGRGKAIALHRAGHLELADARVDRRGGSDARELLAPDAALAGRRRAEHGGRARQHRSRRARASRHHRRHRRRPDSSSS